MIIKLKSNRKTEFTRRCIAEAIIDLMKDEHLDRIKKSAIIKRAGVSRMTFYKYYNSPNAALKDYLGMLVAEYLEESKKSSKGDSYFEYEHILYSLNFFDKYADFFLTLYNHGFYSILIEGVNQFMQENIMTTHELSVYKLYAYAGGLLNTFIKWEENGKQDSAEEISDMIYKLYN